MKSRQLANVLFKVLGFWVCLEAVPSCVSGILVVMLSHMSRGESFEVMRIGSYAIGASVQFVIGIAIISMSRKISGWLFKSDDE